MHLATVLECCVLEQVRAAEVEHEGIAPASYHLLEIKCLAQSIT